MGDFLDLDEQEESEHAAARFSFPSVSNNLTAAATSAHPSPPPTPPRRVRRDRGHRHTQSLFVTPPRPRPTNNTGLQTPPNSRSKTSYYQQHHPYFLTTTPIRSKPTLAMSVHIHSPAPREPSPHHPQRRAYSPRPASPTLKRNSLQQQQEHIPRPPSRSERLLRDTLMRDELERNNASVPPLPSPPRRPSYDLHSRLPSYPCESSVDGCDTDDAADPWSTRGSFLFRTGGSSAAGLVRNKSMGHVHQRSLPHPQGRCTSPTPSRRNLQRSANSMPTAIPRSSSTTNTNTTTTSGSSRRSRSHSHSHTPSISSLPPTSVSPHEAVLRARLEKVLSMGREEQRLQEGVGAGEVGVGSDLLLLHHRSQPYYQRTGKRRSGENSEWLWSSQDWTSSPSPSSTGSDSGSHHSPAPSSPLAYSTTLPPSSPSPTHHNHHHHHPSKSAPAPTTKPKPAHLLLTPPDSPTFNARTASALCRQIEGYVSFANVEGLGEPPLGIEDEDEEAGTGAGGGGGVVDARMRVGDLGMKFGLGKLWKAWGREREVVVVR